MAIALAKLGYATNASGMRNGYPAYAITPAGRAVLATDDLRKHWSAFCDCDPFFGSDTFLERMEAAGYIELIPVDDDALQDSFAAERGIEPGGMMWSLTSTGSRALDLKDRQCR
jgi:hypothetical protein